MGVCGATDCQKEKKGEYVRIDTTYEINKTTNHGNKESYKYESSKKESSKKEF